MTYRTEQPRGMPTNAGQFAPKTHTPPAHALAVATVDTAPGDMHSLGLRVATENLHMMQQVVQRQLVAEIRQNAPAGAQTAVIELHNPGDRDLEVMTFQRYMDGRGQSVPVDGGTHRAMTDIATRIDPSLDGLDDVEKSDDFYLIPIRKAPTRGDHEQAVRDAVALRGSSTDAAAAAHLDRSVGALISHIARENGWASLTFDRTPDGIELTTVRDDDGTVIASAWDYPDEDFDHVSAVAGHITSAADAGFDAPAGRSIGPYSLTITAL